MKIDKARELADEFGIKEGATYNYHGFGDEVCGEVTITKVVRSGRGISKLEWEIESFDEGDDLERRGDLARAVGQLESGFWSEKSK